MAQTSNPPQISASDKFFSHFKQETTDILEQIENLQTLSPSGGNQKDAGEHARGRIARLSNEVRDAVTYLPAHDQGYYNKTIKELNSKLEDAREAVDPKKKFSFKKSGASGSNFKAKKDVDLNDRAADAADALSSPRGGNASTDSSFTSTLPSSAPEAGLATGLSEATRQPSFSDSTAITLNDHTGVHIIVPSSASHATASGTLSNLQNCIIDLTRPTSTDRPFAGLTLKNIASSLLLCGHVNGAAHLTNVKNSIIVVSSRQFRMHDSVDCDVYLLTSSKPIIEDCSGIRFAPLPSVYLMEEDSAKGKQWMEVDDFKWLRNEASPNWKILAERERIEEGVWRDVVPGAVGVGVESVLREVGIATK